MFFCIMYSYRTFSPRLYLDVPIYCYFVSFHSQNELNSGSYHICLIKSFTPPVVSHFLFILRILRKIKFWCKGIKIISFEKMHFQTLFTIIIFKYLCMDTFYCSISFSIFPLFSCYNLDFICQLKIPDVPNWKFKKILLNIYSSFSLYFYDINYY